ncbi:MAG: hypothetical protein K9M80_04900 [Candidatus Marinimicrobia bacterium]|nr:hypothetical protein [Candidatus Neomarinimicrobiota bacterium]
MISSERVGLYSSVTLVLLTIITLGFALTAVPISGAFCSADCVEYPYLDTLEQFPGDFIWMYFAMFMLIAYMVFMVSLHDYATTKKKIFGKISLCFTVLSVGILLLAYFIQSSVIPASLMNGEQAGIPLIIQYNPHGIFIALEELGHIMMSFSFLFIAFIFKADTGIQKYIKWIFIIAFILVVLSFVIVSINHGIVRKDRFEVYIISIDWLVLIINGILMSIVYKKLLNNDRDTVARTSGSVK